MYQSIGFIGVGNMGRAIAAAASKSGLTEELLLANRTPEKARQAAAGLPGARVAENREVAQRCQLIFLGVKPQMMAGVLADLSPTLSARTSRYILVTMAAGLSCARIREMAGVQCPVIRMMPNTPCAIGAGVVQYCGLDVTDEELDQFAALLAPAGLVDRVAEGQIDPGCAVFGCGPAFAYMFIEALADGGVACGVPRDQALRYAAQAVVGAGRLLLESGQHPGALKDAVCSPAGTTIQGVRALEERGFRGAAMEAVIAVYEKTLELAGK